MNVKKLLFKVKMKNLKEDSDSLSLLDKGSILNTTQLSSKSFIKV